ncbi:hypothetical protein [Schleiferilactobacillus perolens]|jgi:hypothetical protein|uniref:hypothetical protein n=1 Tax=Schleiferilactobacillus perolens TaxID=100468 RepID=UPI00235746D2|nr:hypothetical protein [Schleiferilactobacillus perolens]MCI2170698.1 hypothetical protein [Schleiferilactobacillus perolens]
MWQRIKNNPSHVVLGLLHIGIGVFLINHDSYFRWPPGAFLSLANDDSVGFWFVLIGLAYLIWVILGANHVRWNRAILVISTMTMGALATYQLLHWVVLGTDIMPWMSNAAVTAFIILLARRSDADGGDH